MRVLRNAMARAARISRGQCADEFAVAHCDFAADGDDARPAFELPAFERAVVDVHLLRLRGNLAAIIRIVDDQVGIAAEWIVPLRGKRPKVSRPACCGVDERVQVDASRLHAVGVEQVHAVFEHGMPLGILVKSSRPISFCPLKSNGAWSVATRLIRPPRSAFQSIGWLLLVAQRRRHDVFRAFEIRPFGVGFVEHQILDHRLDPDVHAALPRGERFVAALPCNSCGRCRRARRSVGERHQMMHAFGLDARRPALVILRDRSCLRRAVPSAVRPRAFRFRNGR